MLTLIFFLNSVVLISILLASEDKNLEGKAFNILENVLEHERIIESGLNAQRLRHMSGLGDELTISLRQGTASNFKLMDKFYPENKHLNEVHRKDKSLYFSIASLEKVELPRKTKEIICLAQALYFEARGEKILGQIAVAEVILNRVDSNDFPNSICSVISEGGTRLNACQFSYNCDGKSEKIKEINSYRKILKLSGMLQGGTARVLTGGAVFYHSKGVSPSWSKKFIKTAEIGEHFFYVSN